MMKFKINIRTFIKDKYLKKFYTEDKLFNQIIPNIQKIHIRFKNIKLVFAWYTLC